MVAQPPAAPVLGQPAEQGHVDAEPAESDRDIQLAAARPDLVGTARPGTDRYEVDERLAANNDHGVLASRPRHWSKKTATRISSPMMICR